MGEVRKIAAAQRKQGDPTPDMVREEAIVPNAVHRESNPSDEESHILVVRSGQGPPTVNVDTPDA